MTGHLLHSPRSRPDSDSAAPWTRKPVVNHQFKQCYYRLIAPAGNGTPSSRVGHFAIASSRGYTALELHRKAPQIPDIIQSTVAQISGIPFRQTGAAHLLLNCETRIRCPGLSQPNVRSTGLCTSWTLGRECI